MTENLVLAQVSFAVEMACPTCTSCSPFPSAAFCGIPVVMTGTALAVNHPMQSQRQPCTPLSVVFPATASPALDKGCVRSECLEAVSSDQQSIWRWGLPFKAPARACIAAWARCIVCVESCQPQNRISKICHAAKTPRWWGFCPPTSTTLGQSRVCLSGVWHSQPITPKHCLYPKENRSKHTSLAGFLLSVRGMEFSLLGSFFLGGGSPRGAILRLGWHNPSVAPSQGAWPRCPVPHEWALRLWRVQAMLSLAGQVSPCPLLQ